ncbi:YjjG family noncanonical pyrimidine nucleotidase [Streptococcus thermophilus]|uniref:YjjG family noncanonical pyrimidine nucleotidase n=1 Tax=Streptococcus thermophilus TaxID=1308 RepID=UPI000E326FD9|nr:YjjG family noncanonical pyrimidine nucleotidase [Streptococcus thermophilus]AXN97589.1 noncanonical pyrimidine nucleotidase, YjjG family [Streptococcus thermophilus]MCT0003175.1 noncanonical pyrimidine nucleotidase, YjjG family [Streptococcus thermophilus]MCT2902860.1 noncanonical pyrimidine nucleotidase, YjjG family [Streptococcus thermophilus]
MPYKFLLFDLDHTLLDFDRAEDLALNYLLEEAGVASQDLKVYKDYYIPMNRSMWEDLNHGLITKPELLRTRFSRLFDHFGQEVDGSHLAGRYQHFLSQQGQELPQAHAFLSNVKDRGHKIYAATNGVGFIQHFRLQASSILPFFDYIFISDEVGAHKPSTDFFVKITNQVHDFHPSSAFIIGDSLTADIQGGNNAGIDSVWFNPRNLVNKTPAVPTYQVKNYEEILKILSK